MIHIWHEDSCNSAFEQFLKFLQRNDVNAILKGADIRGFNGNSKLCDYLENYNYNREDKYIIFFDDVLDNTSVVNQRRRLDKICDTHSNVIKAKLLSFEYLILKFKHFLNWTEPMKNTKIYNIGKRVRDDFIYCIENNMDWRYKQSIVAFVVLRKNINTKIAGWQAILNDISSENVCTDILSAMTNVGSTEFGIAKTRLGGCWIKDCCFKHDKKVGNMKCRMYKYGKTSKEKATNLWNCTDIHNFIR